MATKTKAKAKRAERETAPFWATRFGALSVAADLYCRLRSSGQTQCNAYAASFGGRHGRVKKESLRKLGGDLERQPQIRARIDELRAQSNDLALLTMAERRAYLARTARAEPETAPTHGNIISAIREDAILAGERKVEGQVSISIDVAATLLAISGESSKLKTVTPSLKPRQELPNSGALEAEAFDLVEPVTTRRPRSPMSQPVPSLDDPTAEAMTDYGD